MYLCVLGELLFKLPAKRVALGTRQAADADDERTDLVGRQENRELLRIRSGAGEDGAMKR